MKFIVRTLAALSLAVFALVAFAVVYHGGVDNFAAASRTNQAAHDAEAAQRAAVRPAILQAERERQAKLRAARDATRDIDREKAVWRGLAQDECLKAIERGAKVPGSVTAEADTWPVARDGEQWVVLADYRAKNAFGIILRGRAACRLTQSGNGFELAGLKVS